MSYFNKVIAYIDLFEKEEKRKNIGFVKITQKDTRCNMQITVKGLRQTDTLKCLIKETASGKEIDEISLINGQGTYSKEFSNEKIGKQELSFSNMIGIQILISGDRYGMAMWKEDAEQEAFKEEITEEIAEEVVELATEEADQTVNMFVVEQQEKVSQLQSVEQQSFLDAEETELLKKKFVITEQDLAQGENTERKEEVRAAEEVSNIDNAQRSAHAVETVLMDKWQQLCRIYPSVHPFSHQKGEYLSIEPKDFVVLQSKYQGLVNNSFLLHGFYNYRHILLGKRVEGEKISYYIGVPGNYYTREKTVAVMFGFEAFESTREESDGRENWSIESIPQGTYGYYLCKVEL